MSCSQLSVFCKEYQTYVNTMTKKILLLGSGELGKEFVIAAKRKGQYVIACDSYAGAPAMQVADEFEDRRVMLAFIKIICSAVTCPR